MRFESWRQPAFKLDGEAVEGLAADLIR